MSDMTMSNAFPEPMTVSAVFAVEADDAPEAPQVAHEPAAVVDTASSIDSKEAAAILGINTNNLRQIVFKKQLLPVGKQGRRTLFDRATVEALAEKRRKP